MGPGSYDPGILGLLFVMIVPSLILGSLIVWFEVRKRNRRR